MKTHYLFWAWCLISVTGKADTISVLGVVVRNAVGERAPGERIGVYTSTELDPRGKLGEDQTSTRGLYGVVVKNVEPKVERLWVIYEGTHAVAEPRQVDLSSGRDEVRQAKADDIQLLERPKSGQTITREYAAKLLAAIAATCKIKLEAGELSQDEVGGQLQAFIESLRHPLGVDSGNAEAVPLEVILSAAKELEQLFSDPSASGVFRHAIKGPLEF